MTITETSPDTFGKIKTISGDEHFINRITSESKKIIGGYQYD